MAEKILRGRSGQVEACAGEPGFPGPDLTVPLRLLREDEECNGVLIRARMTYKVEMTRVNKHTSMMESQGSHSTTLKTRLG